MAFTENDLKRWKDLIKFRPFNDLQIDRECMIVKTEELKTLIARLKAAEKALAQTETFRSWAHHHLMLCQSMPADRTRDFHIHECREFGKALEAWRKEYGK